MTSSRLSCSKSTDIRGFVAVHGHEPIKEKGAVLRIYFRYFQAVAND